MTTQEANELKTIGHHWHAKVWIKYDKTEQDNIIALANQYFQLEGLPFTLGRGWQNYDPVIKPLRTYKAIVDQISANGNQVAMAQLFYNWMTTNNVGYVQLPPVLQELAVITHLAEVGRGYSSALRQLAQWMQDIVQATASWGDYKEGFPPSLKYDEDIKKDYSL